jgi:eisosome protein 1
MYTSHPKIGPEADDAKRADMLHASAVAMAKKMYSQQQKMADQTREAYAGRDDGSSIEENAPRPYVNLQEAAYKLAQERLAKLEEEHKSQKFQEYYGGSPGRRNTLQRRFTMKSRLRRRSSSDGEVDDMEQSERIRQQMSIFSTNLTKVDEQKRAKDREAVLAAAQRNVRAQLKGMDDRVFNDTGKLPPPRKLSEWELKAHEAAQSMHASRNENKGKVNMGGGMFMSPEDVDAIAQSRVQPLLDEINEKAAIERERQEILRSEAEAKKRDEEKSRERDREIKEINKKIKGNSLPAQLGIFVANLRPDQEKAEEKERRQKEKQELKAKKDEEKAIKAEEKRKSKMTDAAAVAEDHHSDHNENEAEPMSHVHPEPLDTTAHHDSSPTEARSPKEAGSPTHKVKTWLKARLHRPRGKSGSGEASQGFIGGATLNSRLNDSSTSLDNRAASMREMAEAGRGRTNTTSRGSTRARDVSPMSSEDGDGDNAKLEKTITPPAKLRVPNEDKGSPSRDSRFREILE